ncbi:single-stranded DNA-binding protein [Myroides guanonis]|uniref:Single-stranded DNA-binding protein n=1 Tax=Myroides guanonis TaxID=1150112 RepID=A0A1I3Q8M0_9FLAO|nr:single-stranded DNA-binding protein [Myroides guanonis]SFJ30005.1 single-strand binding protein [Myroides guanonis]
MSATLNKVMLIGHLGEDVKMHYFENGSCICRFSLATNEVYINKTTNEKITNTEWHQIVVRNKAAELCEKHLSKGDKIYVEGRLRSRQWQAEDGTQKSIVEIHVNDFVFLQTKKENAPLSKEEQMTQLKKQAIDNFIIPKENNDDYIPF